VDREFLRQLAIVDDAVLESEQQVVELLTRPSLTREELISGLSEAAPAATLSSMANVAIQLRTSDALRADYERYVAYLGAIASRSRDLNVWIDSGDLPAVHRYTIESGVARGLMVAEVSSTLCAALASADPCPDGQRPNGEYESALSNAFRVLEAHVGARTKFVPQQYDEAEEHDAVEMIVTDISAELHHTHDSLVELEPPASLQADHDRLRQFLVDAVELFGLAEGVELEVGILWLRMETLDAQKSATAAELSPAALEIVAPFFLDETPP